MGPLKFADILAAVKTNLPVLPPVHNTRVSDLRDIFLSGNIEATHCPTLKDKFLYTFYGRAEYRCDPLSGAIRDGQFKPCALVFNPKTAFQGAFRLFATDSGGFERKGGPKTIYFNKRTTIADLELAPQIDLAPRLIRYFYRTNRRYLSYKPLEKIRTSKWAFEVISYHRMILDSNTRSFDDRASTIEIAFSKGLQLSDIKLIVLPSEYQGTDLLNEVRAKLGILTRYYRSNPKQSPEQVFEVIRSKVESYVRNLS